MKKNNLKLQPSTSKKSSIDFSFYQNHELLQHLHLTKDDIRQFAYSLNKKIEIDTNCQSDNGYCSNNGVFHIEFERGDNNKLVVFATKCIHQKLHFLYSSYVNSKISKTNYNSNYFEKQVDKTVVELFEKFKKLMNHEDHKASLYIYGSFGVGKTHCSFAMANEFLKKGKTVTFTYLSDVISKVKAGFSDTYKKIQSDMIIESMLNCDVLFVDDIGAENTADWFYNEYFINILNFRTSNEKRTFFNSNYSLNELEKNIILKYKSNDSLVIKRIIDRIRALVANKDFQLKGKNYRY